MRLKLAYNIKTNESLICGDMHSTDLPVKSFNNFVRAIYFKECRTIYFRFYSPQGEFSYLDDLDYEISFKACDKALQSFIADNIIPKSVKVLYWQTNQRVKEIDVKF